MAHGRRAAAAPRYFALDRVDRRRRGPARDIRLVRPARSAPSGANRRHSLRYSLVEAKRAILGRKVVDVARPSPAPCIGSIRFFYGRSARNHSTSLSLADARALPVLVALAVDGAALDERRGGPVRVVVPERYFYKSLKWLEGIELLTEDRPGYWESTAGYHSTGDVWREERYAAEENSPAEVDSLLAGRDLSGRVLRSLQAARRDLVGLVARRAVLRDADFRGCQLRGACFDSANLTNARFEGADLGDASFRDADVEGADFGGADLRGASFAGASLFGTSFGDGDRAGASARMPRMNNRTKFDPSALEALTPAQQALVLSLLQAARD